MTSNNQIMNGLAMLVLMVLVQIYSVKGDPQVPCFFVFGDSISDPGNNVIRVNYRPYGVDFPGGVPTGRYNNGLTTVDYLARAFGFSDFVQAFRTANGREVILKGINYASGGGGIMDDTNIISLGVALSIDVQLRNHEGTVSRITNFLQTPQAARNYLNKCIYHFTIGSNDYFYKYLVPISPTNLVTPEQFAQNLINKFRTQLKKLYDLGARKLALAGVPPIGCTPIAINLFGTNGSPSGCVDRFNSESRLYNNKLVTLVDEFNSNFNDAKFIYMNYSALAFEGITTGLFRVTREPCCKVRVAGICFPKSLPCRNRTEHLFWDSFHPSQQANKLLSERTYNSVLPTDTYPIDINQLAELSL